MHEPEVSAFEAPTSGGDPEIQLEIQQAQQRVTSSQSCTHDPFTSS